MKHSAASSPLRSTLRLTENAKSRIIQTLSSIFSSWLAPESPSDAVQATTSRQYPIVEPKDVDIYESPWVQGTRASAYFGPITGQGFIGYRKGKPLTIHSITSFEEIMRAKAGALGANAIVGFELTFDPYATRRGRDGLLWTATGTAALLEPLF